MASITGTQTPLQRANSRELNPTQSPQQAPARGTTAQPVDTYAATAPAAAALKPGEKLETKQTIKRPSTLWETMKVVGKGLGITAAVTSGAAVAAFAAYGLYALTSTGAVHGLGALTHAASTVGAHVVALGPAGWIAAAVLVAVGIGVGVAVTALARRSTKRTMESSTTLGQTSAPSSPAPQAGAASSSAI